MMVTQPLDFDIGSHRVTALASIAVGTSSGSWAEMTAQRSFSAADAWVAANTGHEGIGIAESDLEDAENGTISSTQDGQVFEGLRASAVRIGHSEVVIRGCRIAGTAQPLVRLNPWHGAPRTGVLIEDCTIIGGGAALTQAQHAFSMHAATDGPIDDNSVTIRRCNVYNSSSGIRSHRGVTAYHNWVHDLGQPGAAHRTGMIIVGYGCYHFENYITSGGSSHHSMYFDEDPGLPMHDILIARNILGHDPSSSVSYGMNFKDGFRGPDAFNIQVVNNHFGPYGGVSEQPLGPENCYQYGPYSDANIPWNTAGNIRAGNEFFLTGTPVANA